MVGQGWRERSECPPRQVADAPCLHPPEDSPGGSPRRRQGSRKAPGPESSAKAKIATRFVEPIRGVGMSSETSLNEAITNSIQNWCSENGGGFPIAFVVALDFVNQDGNSLLCIQEMESQPIHRSLGLVTYMDSWYRDDAQMSWAPLWVSGDESDD